jgi:hypothetical protein
MSVKLSAWAWSQKIGVGPKLVLLALADHADDDGVCWPGIRFVAMKCNITHRNVQRHVATLTAANLIEAIPRYREDGTQTTNAYRLLIAETGGYDKIDMGGMSKLTEDGAIDRGRVAEMTPHEPSLEPPLLINPSMTPLNERVPEEWQPMVSLDGFKIPGKKQIELVTLACDRMGVKVSDVIRAFAEYWPEGKIQHGWSSPTAALVRTREVQARKVKGNATDRQQLVRNGTGENDGYESARRRLARNGAATPSP